MTDRIAEIKASVFEGHTIRRVDVKYLLEQLDKRDVDNERLRETNKALESDNYNAELNNSRLLSEIERLKEAQRWIPVSERLPKNNTPVLVTYIGYNDNKLYSNDTAMWSIEFNDYCGGWRWVLDDSEIIVKITHWMPLPAPPTDSGNAAERTT